MLQTGDRKAEAWRGRAADQVGRCQLFKSSYKGEFSSSRYAEHKILRLGHYFVRQIAVTRRAWEQNIASPVYPRLSFAFSFFFPKLCQLLYSIGQTEIILFINISIDWALEAFALNKFVMSIKIQNAHTA